MSAELTDLRKSGDTKVAPLIYGKDGNRFIIVASKGGSPSHPPWFLNLRDDSEVRFLEDVPDAV